MPSSNYTDDNIRTLEGVQHVRMRPGMYIGRLGNGNNPGDGIYVLLKEIIDNSVDEFAMGFGKQIQVEIDPENHVTVRDFGRGIPLDSVVKAVSILNTGGKFDDKVFKKSVGLNGVGTKAVNALSESFYVCSYREGESSWARFERGELKESGKEDTPKEKNGTLVRFYPDPMMFGKFAYNLDYVETMVKNYSYLKKGLTLTLNGTPYKSENGLLDLVNENLSEEPLYPPIHLEGEDIEIVLSHGRDYGENISSFVNGQNTRDGGTHLAAYREAIAKTFKEFFKKNYAPEDWTAARASWAPSASRSRSRTSKARPRPSSGPTTCGRSRPTTSTARSNWTPAPPSAATSTPSSPTSWTTTSASTRRSSR